MVTEQTDSLLQIKDLEVQFITRYGVGKAIESVSLNISEGETVGLVGESGCGKSVLAQTIVGLLPKPAGSVTGGEVLFKGEDLLRKTNRQMTNYRGKHIAMILQDPLTALNPVFTVKTQISEPLRFHQGLKGKGLKDRVIEILNLLRIHADDHLLHCFPHQFSGGMRQRVVGAIAVACGPELLIADEPTTSLDVTVQLAYLDMLKDLQEKTGMSILFITHDFGIVAKMCDRAIVMYSGHVMESASTEEIFESPAHPYTQALINSVLDVSSEERKPLLPIEGSPPSIYNKPPGCPFSPRCKTALPVCHERRPDRFTRLSETHTVNCWKYLSQAG